MYNNSISVHKVRNIKSESLGLYILSLSFILECRSIWSYQISIAEHVRTLSVILVLFSSLIILSSSKIKLSKKTIQVSFLLLFYFLAYSVIRPINLSSFYRVCSITILLWIVTNIMYKKDHLLFCYENLVVIIATVSLFFWLFGSILGIIKPTGIVQSGWTMLGKFKDVPSYYGLYYSAQDSITYLGLHRNTAIFVEAPMSSFHFSLAFMVETLLRKRQNLFKLIILLFATLTTLSTTGFLCLLSIYLYKLYTTKSQRSIISVLKRISIPFITIIIIIVGWIAFSSKINSGSGIYRIDDFKVGFRAWKSNPIFGGGFSNTAYLMSFTESWRSHTVGFSNSLTEILAFGGIAIFSLYAYAFFAGIKEAKKNKDFNRLFFILIFLMVLLITVVSYNYLTIYILLWMVKKSVQ